MNLSTLLDSVTRRSILLLGAALAMFCMAASLGAGPDEPKASNVADDWEIFQGHAYADNRAAPAGVSLVACLGSCELGHVTPAVTTGPDGIYEVMVLPGPLRPEGRMVTFWLVDGDQWVEADQDVLFRGRGETRVLDLNFDSLPVATNGAPSANRSGSFTADLAAPSASALGLLPSNSPRAYVSGVRFGGLPILPAFVGAMGALLAMIGASFLLYRRRLIWR